MRSATGGEKEKKHRWF